MYVRTYIHTVKPHLGCTSLSSYDLILFTLLMFILWFMSNLKGFKPAKLKIKPVSLILESSLEEMRNEEEKIVEGGEENKEKRWRKE